MSDRRLFPKSLAAAGAAAILFGADYAPEPIESPVDQLPGLKLAPAFEQAMLRGNAERLFRRFKS